jgi:hypothetical protein
VIQLTQQEGDSNQFIEMVEALVNGAARASGARRVYVIKIDKWFPAKWCEFSGKQPGAVGIWKRRLTLPPFVPSRVVTEACHELSPDRSNYARVVLERPIHVPQASADNLGRFVDRFDSGAAFFWYSGSTENVGKGCLMAYLPASDRHVCWYAEIQLRDRATLGLLRGISNRELKGYAEA